MKNLSLIVFIALIALPFKGWGQGESSVEALPEVKVDASSDLADFDYLTIPEAHSETIVLEDRFSFPISDQISRVPSVQVTQLNWGAPPGFVLQGMNSDQVRIFLEGQPLGDPFSQAVNAALIPTLAIESVKVFSSAVPAQFLSNSLGGALDIRLASNSKKTRFLAQVGNLGFLKAASSSSLLGSHQIDIEWSQSKENFSYLDNNGTPLNASDDSMKERVHNGFQKLLLLPRFSWQPSTETQFQLFSLNAYQWTEVPGPVHTPDFYDLKELKNFTVLKSQTKLEESSFLESSVYLQFQKDSLANDSSDQKREQWGTGARLAGFWKTSELIDTSLGIGVNHYQVGDAVPQIDLPLYLNGVARVLEGWMIKPALLGQVSLSGSKVDSVSPANISPRLGWEYQVSNPLRLRGMFGRFFRTPSLAEKLGNTWGLESNPNLRVETAYKTEAGVDWFFSDLKNQFHVASTWFGVFASDLIAYVPSNRARHKAENVGRAKWFGQELLAEMQTSWGLTVRPSATLLFSQNDSDIEAQKGRQLPNRYPFSSRIDLIFQRHKSELGYRASYFSSSYLDKENIKKMEGFLIHDFFFGFNTRTMGRFELNVANFSNIQEVGAFFGGDQTSSSISGFLGYPVPGRRMSALWKFDW